MLGSLGRWVCPARWADGIRAAAPGLDVHACVAAAGATIGGLVAVVLHALERNRGVDEVRAALTATLDQLERTMIGRLDRERTG